MLYKFMFLFTMMSTASLAFAAEPPAAPQPEKFPKLHDALEYAKEHDDFRMAFYKQHESEFLKLINEGQNPEVLLVSCSDSRLISDLIVGTKPGTAFVIRNAGNFVPAYDPNDIEGTGATLQYGVEVLKIKHIIVCGHSHCGAIRGLFEPVDPEKMNLLKGWLRWGDEAKRMTLLANPKATTQEKYELAEHLSVIYQLEHLMTYPFIRERVKRNELVLHGWYYDIADGSIDYYDPEKFSFLPLISSKKNREEKSDK